MNKRAFIDESREQLFSGMGIPEKEQFVADDFQKEAISSVVEGHDTLVVAPTGSGKTYIAFEAIDAYLRLGKRAVYTTPLKALSNTKYNELKVRFEPEFHVGLLTGDRKIETDAHVVVATTEIFRNELYHHGSKHSLVVLDEVHFIADPQRGAVWEESIILAPSSSALLMLSASISNATEIADWLAEVRGRPCRIVTKVGRPVALRYGFLHPDLGVIPLEGKEGQVFPEVTRFYSRVGLDSQGMRLKGPRREQNGPPRRSGGRRGGKRR